MRRFRLSWLDELDEELVVREAYALACQKAFEVQAAGFKLN